MPTKQESNWSKKNHWSLECWYRFSLVFRRKPNANRNQTGLKYTLVLTKLIQNPPGIYMQKNTKGQQESNWSKIHTGPHNAGIESIRYQKVKHANRNQTGLKYTLVLTMLVQNPSGIQEKTKCQQESNCCKIHTGPYNAGIESVWYLAENQMPRNQTAVKYTMVLTILVQNQSDIKQKPKCQQDSNWSYLHTGP